MSRETLWFNGARRKILARVWHRGGGLGPDDVIISSNAQTLLRLIIPLLWIPSLLLATYLIPYLTNSHLGSPAVLTLKGDERRRETRSSPARVINQT